MNVAEMLAKRESTNQFSISDIANQSEPEVLTNNEVTGLATFAKPKPLVPSQLIEPGVQYPKTFTAKTIDPNDDPADIPVKDWLIKDYLLSGYISLLISPGAVGKSILTIIEAISVALGKDLLKLGHIKQGNVLLINNEDDDDEINRRIDGVCIEYKLDRDQLSNHLFTRSGYGDRVVIATDGENNTIVETNVVNEIIGFIQKNNVRFLIMDPFISSHTSDENNNSKIDQVIQIYRKIGIETSIAMLVVHHTPKCNSNQSSGAGDVDMARGASSLKDAARVAHTLFPMSDSEAKEYGLHKSEQLRYVRLDDAKTNFSLKTAKPKWLYKKSVVIANGEEIGVLAPHLLEAAVISKEEKAEKDKSAVIHDIARAAIIKLGAEGGKISSPDLVAEYMNVSGYAISAAKNNISLLPIGTVKQELVKINGVPYRIYQTKGAGQTGTRYVHIGPD